MRRSDFKWFHTLRVRFSEVDNQAIVYNANYLTYFDVALTEYWRSLVGDYMEFVRRNELGFHLVKASVEYLRPVHLDELIEIGVRVQNIGRSSITWNLGVFRQGHVETCTRGEIVWVCSRPGEHRSHAVPADVRELLKHGTADPQ